ncbi:MAG TPA: hypothetical protein VHC63_10185 [Acidimicrobiales bacterium]|nr:hypothetical protein [Acidimicrobiales bacterium]
MTDEALETEPNPELLAAPSSDEQIYLARGADVPTTRPRMTGDVLKGISPAGLSAEYVIVLTHPCSMRSNGVDLAERIVVAGVEPHQYVGHNKWTGYGKVMPLPALVAGAHYAAYFEQIGVVSGDAVVASERVACLSDEGTNLLQQRFIHNLTRFVVPTYRLHEACRSAFREVDLLEEWLEAAAGAKADMGSSGHEFHEWIRETDGSSPSRQDRLKDPQQEGAIQRELRQLARARFNL